MTKLKKAMSALVLGATLAGATATAADAQRWRGGPGWNRGGGWNGGWNRGYYGRRGGVSSGAAVGIGLLGLGVGAAIASQPRYNGYYGGGGYGFAGPGYYGGPGYYDGYYGGGYRECYTRRFRDPWTGERIRERVCN